MLGSHAVRSQRVEAVLGTSGHVDTEEAGLHGCINRSGDKGEMENDDCHLSGCLELWEQKVSWETSISRQ